MVAFEDLSHSWGQCRGRAGAVQDLDPMGKEGLLPSAPPSDIYPSPQTVVDHHIMVTHAHYTETRLHN